MNSVKLNITSFESSTLYKYWIKENPHNLMYVNFISCLCHINEEFFDEIVEKLKNY